MSLTDRSLCPAATVWPPVSDPPPSPIQEENGRLRGRVLELEAGLGGDTAELSRELHTLRAKTEKLEAENKLNKSRKPADPAAAKAQEESMKVIVVVIFI